MLSPGTDRLDFGGCSQATTTKCLAAFSAGTFLGTGLLSVSWAWHVRIDVGFFRGSKVVEWERAREPVALRLPAESRGAALAAAGAAITSDAAISTTEEALPPDKIVRTEGAYSGPTEDSRTEIPLDCPSRRNTATSRRRSRAWPGGSRNTRGDGATGGGGTWGNLVRFPRDKKQGRRDSNPRPTVLETAALPAELRPSASPGSVTRRVRHDPGVGRYGMPLLFSALTAVFAVIAVSSAIHHQWVIAVAAVAIGGWMSTFAWAALRKTRR